MSEDGSTLQLGYGGIPDAVVVAISQKNLAMLSRGIS